MVNAALTLCLVLLIHPSGQDDASRSEERLPPGELESYQAHIAAAEKSLRLGESSETSRWLSHAPTRHRDWEWQFLQRAADSSISMFERPTPPSRIVCSPSGDRLATIEGTDVQIWSLPDMTPVVRITEHHDAVYRVAFDPSGERVITVSRDVTSRVWNARTGEQIAMIELDNPAFAAAAFSPDGMVAATCAWMRDSSGVHGVVWLWDSSTGEVLHRKLFAEHPLSSICFSSNGDSIYVGCWDGVVYQLDSEANETARIALPDDGIYNAINDIAISRDDRFLAAGTKDRTIRVVNLETLEVAATLKGHDGFVESLAFSTDGQELASASVDATIRLWDTTSWTQSAVLRGHRDTVAGVVFFGEDRSLASCSLDGSVRFWRSGRHNEIQSVFSVDQDGTYTTTFLPDGRNIVVACYSGDVLIVDAKTTEIVRSWNAHDGSSCNTLAIDATGNTLATCSWDQTCRVWNLNDGELITTIEADAGVYDCDLSPDGASVALAAGGHTMLYDVRTGEQQFHHETPSVREVIFDGSGKRVAAATGTGHVFVWDAETGSLVAEWQANESSANSVSFSPDGHALAIASADGRVRLLNVDRNELEFTVDLNDHSLNRVAFHPLGRRLVAGGKILYWIDRDTGAEVFRWRSLRDTVWNLDWSPDGANLAACSTNGEISILSISGPTELEHSIDEAEVTADERQR